MVRSVDGLASAGQFILSSSAFSMRRFITLQFSLRAFWLTAIVVGTAVGWYVNRAQRQFHATQLILSQGGSIYYDYQIDSSKLHHETIRAVRGPSRRPWVMSDAPLPGVSALRDLLGIDYFATVVGVEVREHSGSVSDLSVLEKLPNLRWVDIMLSYSSDCDFSALSNLTEVIRIEIHNTNFKDLTFIQDVHKLRYLKLDHNGDVADYQPISKLVNLERIDIGAEMESTAPLANLTALKSARVTTKSFDVEDFRRLSGLKQLTLYMWNSSYSKEQASKLDQVLPTTHIYIRSTTSGDFYSPYDSNETSDE